MSTDTSRSAVERFADYLDGSDVAQRGDPLAIDAANLLRALLAERDAVYLRGWNARGDADLDACRRAYEHAPQHQHWSLDAIRDAGWRGARTMLDSVEDAPNGPAGQMWGDSGV